MDRKYAYTPIVRLIEKGDNARLVESVSESGSLVHLTTMETITVRDRMTALGVGERKTTNVLGRRVIINMANVTYVENVWLLYETWESTDEDDGATRVYRYVYVAPEGFTPIHVKDNWDLPVLSATYRKAEDGTLTIERCVIN